MRGLLAVATVVVLFGASAAGVFIGQQAPEDPVATGATDRRVAIAGGYADVGAGVVGGERFLKQVPVPEHLVNPYTPDPEDEKPGDGHDDPLLTLSRRHTDRSYYEKPWTGGLWLTDVHGTPTNPVCICDAVFIMYNESGHDPGRPIRIISSSYILVDNLTIYGGGIVVDWSHHVTITRTLMLDSGGIVTEFSDDGLISDVQIGHHGGPMAPVQVPFFWGNVVGSPCWPEPTCTGALIELRGGSRWTVEWSYLQGTGGVANTGSRDTVLRHNSVYGGGLQLARGEGIAEWNLMRSWGRFGLDVAETDFGRIENNSIVFYVKISAFDVAFQYKAGLLSQFCGYCIARNNDFVGHGTTPDLETSPVETHQPGLRNRGSYILADDNYWGTVHDPRIPPGRWIENYDGGVTDLSRWFTRPVHDLTPLAPIVNPQDIPYWVDRAVEELISPPGT